MIDPIRRLLTEAGNAKQTRAFWQAATGVLSDWAGGAHVQLDYQGLNESGTAQAGAPDASGEPFFIEYHDAEGRHVRAGFRGVPEGFPADVLRSALEIATHLGVMVARRAGLERERRLGTFLVELSRWLLAAPERDLLLKYTLQSVVSLVEAQGAFVALRQRDGDMLRIAATVGQSAEMQGCEIGLTTSTTGRVVPTGGPPRSGRTQWWTRARSRSPWWTGRAASSRSIRPGVGCSASRTSRRRSACTSRRWGCRPARSRSTWCSPGRRPARRGTGACSSPSPPGTGASAIAPSRGCRAWDATTCWWPCTTGPTSCARSAS